MGKKSQPAPPPAPNPYEIIGAEAQANRVNQITPLGSLTYSGPNNNTATLSLNDQLQGLLNQQMGMDQNVLNLAQQNLSQLPQNAAFGGFGIPGQTGVSQSIPGLQTFTGQLPQAPQLSSPYAAPLSAPNLQTGISPLQGLQNPQLQQNIAAPNLSGNVNTPNLQGQIGGLDFGGIPGLPQNYQAYQNNAERAFFDRSAGLLNEQFGREEESLRQRLANQGLQVGGEAFGNELGQFNQRKGDTFGNLARDAVLFGGQEASRSLADQLALRGAGTNEALARFNSGLTQGQFANQASQQGFQNQLAGLGFGNETELSRLNANLGIAGFGNQAALQQAGMVNDNALNLFNSGLTQGNFQNQAALQQFGLSDQIRNQQLQNQQLGNDTALQQFGLQNQQLQNQLQQIGLNNAGRTQLFNETAAARGTQFNELASLLGLQQVNQPQLQNFYSPGQVGAADAFGLQQSTLNNNYNTQANNAAAKKGSTAELAGALGTAAIFMSDRRLKSKAEKIGEFKGYNVYSWLWNKAAEKLGLVGRAMGVMADEIPLQYLKIKDGYLAVDYGALCR